MYTNVSSVWMSRHANGGTNHRSIGSGGGNRGGSSGHGPFSGRRGSIGPKAVVLPSLRTSTGQSVCSPTETTLSSTEVSSGSFTVSSAAARMKEEYELMVADHAWVDQDDEMDYDFVPFSDETTTSLAQINTSSVLASSSMTGSPLALPPEIEEDPVLKALRQRQQLEAESKSILSHEVKGDESPLNRTEAPVKTAVPTQSVIEERKPAPPAMSWRSTARPVVAEPPKPAYTIAQRPKPVEPERSSSSASEVSSPREPSKSSRGLSALDLLISSIKNAAKSHDSDSEASSRMLLFGTETEEEKARPVIATPPLSVSPTPALPSAPPAPAAIQAPSGEASRQRTLNIRLEIGKAPVQTRFTILGPQQKASQEESTGKVQYSERHPIRMSALRVHRK